MFEIQLFGKFEIRYQHKVIQGLEAQKVQELMIYLLLHRDRPHSRELLASVLWGDCTTAQAKTYLRKALWKLHAALRGPSSTISLIELEPGWVRINPKATVQLDIARLEQAYLGVHGIGGHNLSPEQVDHLRQAADLYRGDLLDGWYQDWCLYERERLQQQYLVILDKLMSASEAEGNYEAGLEYGTRILRLERARECTHRHLIRLYALAGDRTAALRQYARCVEILRDELGVPPDEETVELVEQLQSNSTIMRASSRLVPSPSATLLHSVLDRLRLFQEGLITIQQQVQQEIETVELVLRSSAR